MAHLVQEIRILTKNEPGKLAKVTRPIRDAGVNISTLCAWSDVAGAKILLITEDNPKAMEVLKKANYFPEASEVLITTLPNVVGTLEAATQKIGQAGINIEYCYFTVCGESALGVFSTDDNAKAAKLLT